MTSLQISEENLLKMISDVKNMKKEFRCAFLSCDLNEDRIIVSGQAEADTDGEHGGSQCFPTCQPQITIKHSYIRGGPASCLSMERKMEIWKQLGCRPSDSWTSLQNNSNWQQWIKLCESESSPPKRKKPRENVSTMRRVEISNLVEALEVVASIINDCKAPKVKEIQFDFKVSGPFKINIRCAEAGDYLWFGGHVNIQGPDIFDHRYSRSAVFLSILVL